MARARNGCIMTRTSLPLRADDLSNFTRALSRQLGDSSPSHLSLMNMLARAAGFQNVQHMRALAAAATRSTTEHPVDQIVDHRSVQRTLQQFDDTGRLIRWPSRQSVQRLALFAIWARLPADRNLREAEVNATLQGEHLFSDPATLRRTMISNKLLTRKADGSDYRRIEQSPPPEARAVMLALRDRRERRAKAATAP